MAEAKPPAGKLALITGASRGLGKAMAVALAEAGARLVLVARDQEKLAETARAVEQAGARAWVYTCDVTSQEQVQELEQKVRREAGLVDILINNAGVNVRKPLEELTLRDWRLVLDTNLTSVFLMCKAFVPHMKGRGYGRVINLTSIMSWVALPGRTAYCSSKAGLLGFTRALALELAPEKITVVGISPGPFATEMNRVLIEDPKLNEEFMSRVPLRRWGNVEEVGKLAVYLCTEEAGFITGTDILIDGGWTAQ